MDAAKLKQMHDALDDPEIGENVKTTIRAALAQIGEGGLRAAYNANLAYLSRNDIDSYSEYVFGFAPFTHHKEITRVLQDESKKRLLIVAPPGHAKSTYVSLVFPSWWMGKNPEKAAILVSNTSTQAEAFLASIKATIADNDQYKQVFPEALPDEARGWTQEKLFLANRENKSRPDPNLMSTGMTGPVLGRRAELVIVDDPTSQKDAGSEKVMRDQKLWFKETLMSRVKPGGRVVVILTRWHDKDLASMLVNDMDFEVVHMAAIGDEEGGAYVDYLPSGAQPTNEIDPRLLEIQKEVEAEGHRAKIVRSATASTRFAVRKYLHEDGERALWAWEHDMAALNRFKKDYGTVRFNLVYQGDPTGMSGDIFKRDWFQYYGPNEEVKKAPPNANIFQSVDTAITKNTSSDYTVVTTVARDSKGNIYVLDVKREKLEAPDQPKHIITEYKKHAPIFVLMETVQAGLATFQHIVRTGIPIRKYNPRTKDKESRARSASAIYEQEKIYLPRQADWVEDFINEHTSFPRGEHDDQVDTMTQLLEDLGLNWNTTPREVEIDFG